MTAFFSFWTLLFAYSKKKLYLCSVFRSKDMTEYTEQGIYIQEVDARFLERDLERTAAIIDRHRPFVVLITHYDELLATDHALNYQLLGKLMGVHIGLIEDKEQILHDGHDLFRHVHVTYGHDIEQSIRALTHIIAKYSELHRMFSKRHLAIRLLEREEEILQLMPSCPEVVLAAQHERESIASNYGKSAAAVIREARQGFVHGALEETLTHAANDTGHSFSDKLDKVLTNRWFGLPILVAILYLVFWMTFKLGAYPQAWIGDGIDSLVQWLTAVMPNGWLTSLFVDGIVQGIGAVISFLPNIIILFFFLCIMEDTGYMSRAAYLMDKIMHMVGLHGGSFIPMLVGFGCNVPAIMACRNIENNKDRALTMLMIPFMSCSARLPVYMLFVGVFFPHHQPIVMMSLYLIGIVLSILFALVMKQTRWFRQPEQDYVSTLPPFRKPTWRTTGRHIWERTWDYLQKIGTIILWASIVIWALTYFPTRSMDLEHSYLAMIGLWTEPLVRPLGFDWKMSVCLLTGLPAKEAIVSTMGILFHSEPLATAFSPLTAFGFMVFVLLYFPCVATVKTLRKELSAKWATFTVIHSLCLAWIMAFLIHSIGNLLL